MDPEFWQSRWCEGRIGFHKPDVNPLLIKYFNALNLPTGSRVLVPLCGKSVDMIWLARQGFDVVGVELVESAVVAFFDEQGIVPTVSQPSAHKAVKRYQATLAEQNIELWVADIFALEAVDIGGIDAVYDRAALIAMPPNMRQQYGEQIRQISAHAPQLLITLNYDQSKKDGPPFSVNHQQVKQYYGDHYQTIELVDEPTTIGSAPDISVTQHVWLLSALHDNREMQ